MKFLLEKWDSKKEAEIWSEAIFVFDSSTLLNFYEYSEQGRQEIYSNIFPNLTGRLWITNQSEFEILKHQQKQINRPVELYQEIKDKHYPAKAFKKFVDHYEQLKDRTSKGTHHPFIPRDLFNDLDNGIEFLKKDLEILEKSMDTTIEKQLLEHKEVMKSDKLLEWFQVTSGYTFSRLMDLVREGEFRYRNRIPPGFMDEKEKEELGITKFADLVIWKQMIDLAKQVKLPILLIIDDLKVDWCITDKNDKRKLISPRHELVKEMLDEGGVLFFAYSASQFLYKANEILNSELSSGVIEQAKQMTDSPRSKIELAVYNWASTHFNADETVFADKYWLKDTGADIIQTLDGVAFSLQVKYVTSTTTMKQIEQYLEKAKKVNNPKYTFESNIIVFVCDTYEAAARMRYLVARWPIFTYVVGYINSQEEFEEVNMKNS